MSSENAIAKSPRTKKGAWPPDMDRRLREAYAAGKSTATIARELGRSRSAVCGRAHRLGLKFEAQREARPAPSASIPPRPPRLRVIRLRPPGRAVRVRTVEVDCLPKQLVALGPRECRYCVEDADEGHMEQALFCAAATRPGRSYCGPHEALASLGRKDDVDALTLELASHLARGHF